MLASTESKDLDDGLIAFSRAGRAVEAHAVGEIHIRPMGQRDLDRILMLRSVVGWSADPDAFWLLLGMREARWAVAEASDGGLAGMVGAIPLGRIGILCHLAVRDDYRGMGLGTRLCTWAVLYLRSRGARVVRLYSTGRAESVYRSLGFKPEAARTVYRLEEAPKERRARGEAGGHRVETLVLGDLPELYGLDYWSYGADRSALILATLRWHPGGGLVARDASGRIKGYLVRSDSGGATRIGPFLASTPDVARLLLARALRLSEGSPVEAIVTGPTGSPAHDLLAEFGFTGSRDRLRMELGDAPTACRRGLEHYGTTPYLAT